MLTIAEIQERLWGPHSGGSENRVIVLIDLLYNAENDEEFWRIFQLGWPTSDNTWYGRTEIKCFLDQRQPAGQYLVGEDKAFYDSLPQLITVYRGCSFDRVRGLAWTTERDIACQFAKGHRQIAVSSAVVATAQIPKEAIYTVTTNRKEFEVVLNWKRLRKLEIEWFSSDLGGHHEEIKFGCACVYPQPPLR